MRKLSIDDIVDKINKGITFEAHSEDDSFHIKIEDYAPYVCAAIHNGHNLRPELQDICLLKEQERWYEEDPETGNFISSFPITIIGLDSRYEYDLNRAPESAIYEEAWGKKVWNNLNTANKQKSLAKHCAFYRVVSALIEKLEKQFGACLVFDVHSYNYKRYDRELPVFNIGTERIDNNRFDREIKYWKSELEHIEIPNIDNTVAINGIFYGRGYFLEFITQKFNHTLVFATEVKKVYCDENTGTMYPLVISAIGEGMKTAILNTAAFYAKNYTRLKLRKKNVLLSSDLDDALVDMDSELYNLARDFEILELINPVNLEEEKKAFFKSHFRQQPEFLYRQLNIDPFHFKRLLYNIKIENIKDIHIQNMYADTIQSLADEIDMIASIGQENFLYNSLRVYGEPGDNDIQNANFFLSCMELPEINHTETIDTRQAAEEFKRTRQLFGFDCNIEISDSVVSKALSLNNKQKILLKNGVRFSEIALNGLIYHEAGVHMLTTLNARLQPLKICSLGMPRNTLTQEGLAILSEYLSGNLSIMRMKELALRVLGIRFMLNGNNFAQTFEYLMDSGVVNEDKAFYLTTRIFRGGGFTKDYLYFRGFRDVFKYYTEGKLMQNLLVGKTSIDYVHVINELIDRKILLPPKYKTGLFQHKINQNPTLEFLVKSIR